MNTSGMFVLHSAVNALMTAECIRYAVTYCIVEGGVGIADYVRVK